MNLYIHEWPDNSATVMLDNGNCPLTFKNISQALEICGQYSDNYDQVLIQQQTPSP